MKKRPTRRKKTSGWKKPPVTWKSVESMASLMVAILTRGGALKLPIGKTSTAKMIRRCDEWLRTYFEEPDLKLLAKTPEDLAVWLAARFYVAGSFLMTISKLDPDPIELEDELDILAPFVVGTWEEMMEPLWSSLYYLPDGKIGRRPALIKMPIRKNLFSPN